MRRRTTPSTKARTMTIARGDHDAPEHPWPSAAHKLHNTHFKQDHFYFVSCLMAIFCFTPKPSPGPSCRPGSLPPETRGGGGGRRGSKAVPFNASCDFPLYLPPSARRGHCFGFFFNCFQKGHVHLLLFLRRSLYTIAVHFYVFLFLFSPPHHFSCCVFATSHISH